MDSQRAVQSAFFAVLLAVFAYLTVLILRPFLTYLLAVLLLAFLFRPLQRRLEPRLGTRPAAFVLVIGAITIVSVVVVLIGLTLPADATQISQSLKRLLDQTRIEDQIEGLLGIDVPLESVLADVPRRAAQLIVGDLSQILGTATDIFLGVLLVLFLFYYLLADGDRLVEWVIEKIPLPRETTDELVEETYVTTWAVLKGHVFIAIIQGVVAGIGLWVVGLPNVVFWTVVMMLLELFPVVGVAGVLGPAALYLFFVGRPLAAGFIVIYGITAVAVVDDYVRALVIDRESSLHSATILLGVFGGVYAFGLMGLFYGPIVLGLFQTLVRLFYEGSVVDEP